MKSNRSTKSGGSRRQVPSHHPMSGIDESPIDAGATSGAQLPPAPDANNAGKTKEGDEAKKPGPNPNQGDLLTPFWSHK